MLLEELAKDHTVWLKALPRGVWECDVSYMDEESGDVKYRHREKGKTPEEAIRKAYLKVNPIPVNDRTGKLSQG